MKRSEVNNKIQEYILDYATYDDNISLEGAADNILDYLEVIGMLPPNCTVKVENGRHTPTERRWDEEY